LVIGAAAYDLPKFDVVLPNFPSFTEPSPSKTASAPIPDPVVGATLREMQSAQQQDVAAVQESGALLKQNTAILQQGAATLESLKQGLTVQQTTLKSIANQVSSLIARVDSLQNAVTPLTTSSIPQPNARARSVGTSRKKTSRLPEPVGPVSVGGAPRYIPRRARDSFSAVTDARGSIPRLCWIGTLIWRVTRPQPKRPVKNILS
jgi:hypothetical protein